ncbi:MAG: hypothetical protein U0V74_00975 [Chitinophagales bacterium]
MSELHQLIHTLKKEEKRLFKLYAKAYSGGKESSYLKLFDALEAQEVYNEAEILKKHRKESFVKNYSAAKHHLYDLLLKVLRVHFNESDVHSDLNAAFDEIRILHSKGLVAQAQRAIRRLWTDIDEAGGFHLALRLTNFERGLMADLKYEGEFKMTFEELQERDEHSLESIALYNRIYHYHTMVKYYMNKKGNLNVQEDLKNKVKAILSTQELREDPVHLIFRGRHWFYMTHLYGSILLEDTEGMYKAGVRLVKLWDEHPAEIKREPYSYLATLYNFLNGCILHQQMDEFEVTLEKMANLSFTTKRKEAVRLYYLYSMKVWYYTRIHNTEKLNEVIAEVQQNKNMQRENLRTDAVLHLFLNISFGLIEFNRFSEALDWLNELKDENWRDVREDFQLHVHLCRLICFFEMGEMEVFGNLLRSVKRNMDEALKDSPFKLVTDYFTQLLSPSFLPSHLPQLAADYYRKLDDELNKMPGAVGDNYALYLNYLKACSKPK